LKPVTPELQRTIGRAVAAIDATPAERKRYLDRLAAFVSAKRAAGEGAALTLICTHNSRRSQMGQVWAAVAAAWFGIEGVRTYSGGTEVTAFNPRAVAALRRAGFSIDGAGRDNPRYRVVFAEDAPALECFSKTYDDASNPAHGFAAIMTCADADVACPVVFGAAARLPIRYEDPKVADGTAEEAAAYDERCLQIATEMLYAFSRVD
jgi:arsenate reductase